MKYDPFLPLPPPSDSDKAKITPPKGAENNIHYEAFMNGIVHCPTLMHDGPGKPVDWSAPATPLEDIPPHGPMTIVIKPAEDVDGGKEN